MLVKFLGVRGAYPTHQQLSSMLLTLDSTNILIDVGSVHIFTDIDVLLKTNIVFLTHNHNDHVALLPNYVIARWHSANRHSVQFQGCKIYSPEPIANIMATMGLVEGELYTNSCVIPKSIDDIQIDYIQTMHPMKNYCYKLTKGSTSIAVTGDTSYFDALANFCNHVDLLICEASVADENSHKAIEWGHMTPSMVATLCNNAQPKKVLLTHFSEVESQEFIRNVKKDVIFNCEISAAYEGMTTILR